jgi:hypothetical protein
VRNKGREDHQIQPEPKTPLQPIRPPIQTQINIRSTLQTNQTIWPLLKNTQIWPTEEVRQEESRKSRRVMRSLRSLTCSCWIAWS